MSDALRSRMCSDDAGMPMRLHGDNGAGEGRFTAESRRQGVRLGYVRLDALVRVFLKAALAHFHDGIKAERRLAHCLGRLVEGGFACACGD